MDQKVIKNSTGYQLLLNNSSQALQFGSRWLLTIFLLKYLSIEKFALFSFVYSLSNILLSVLPFGSSTFLISRQYKNLDEKQESIQRSFYIVSFLFIAFLLMYFILSPLLNGVKGWLFIPYGIFLSLFFSLNLTLFSFYKGLDDFKSELKSYIVFAFGIVLIIGLIYFGVINEVILIFIILIGLNFIVFLIALFQGFRNGLLVFYKFNFVKITGVLSMLAERKYFGFQEITVAVCTQLGMVLLYYIIDEVTYGYYRAFFVILAPFFMLSVATSQVLLNKLKSLPHKLRYSFFRKVQLYLFLLALVFSLALLIFRSQVLSFFELPINFSTITSYYLVVTTLIMRYVFSNYEMLLVVLGRQNQRFWIMLFSAFISIILLFILPTYFGLIGAVLINAISYAVILIGCLYISEKNAINQIKSF